MQRKAALIGCREGHMIRTSGMRRLRINARVQSDVMVKVEQYDHENRLIAEHTFVGTRYHPLDEAVWTRVLIVDGPHLDALCVLEAA